jgi:hypothetical protein
MSKDLLTPYQLAALGSVVVESADLENKLNMMLQDLTGLSDAHLRIMNRGSMLQQKLEAVEKLGEQKFTAKSSKARLKNAITYLKQRNTERTIIVHGVWRPGGGGGALAQLAAYQSGQPLALEAVLYKNNATFKASELDKLALKIQIATGDLWELFMEKRAKPAAKRNEYRRQKRKEYNEKMLRIKQQIEGMSAAFRRGSEVLKQQRNSQAHKKS